MAATRESNDDDGGGAVCGWRESREARVGDAMIFVENERAPGKDRNYF